MAPREQTVGPNSPMPKGYAFLKKGIKYKTLHCRKLTHEASKPVYVVESNKKVLGIRVPKDILFHVHTQANETLSARKLATEKRDSALIRAAAAEVNAQFPTIPEHDREKILKHGFEKHSGRVGRTGQVPLPRKVLLAVIAHIRHKHTKYDQLLAGGVDKDAARKVIQKQLRVTLKQWGCTQESEELDED
ncbi:hypothetical protein N0V90_008830 [Kalmusia sp. IMI 367209]|nr:hypothetical protein N0V90_008830 [Kalmusia sp. IMI 367209]